MTRLLVFTSLLIGAILYPLAARVRPLPFWMPTSMALPTDTNVPSGGDLQAAINNAVLGDSIILAAGGSYICSCTLPVKSGSSYLTIKSSAAASLTGRVNPSQVGLMANVTSLRSAEATFTLVPTAHHYMLQGLNIKPDGAGQSFSIITLGATGTSQDTLAEVPHHVVIDKNWIHGGSTQEAQRGITLNAATVTITNNHISDIHGRGYDTQAICGWNGPGPFSITNNYLEAAGENLMIGGADTSIPNMVPTGILINQNYFFKPLTWKVGHPSYAGIHWSIKNLLELKMGRNVTIDGNVLENSWGDAQIGYAVLFTVRNQDGGNPWAILENILFTNNTITNSEQGFQILGVDYLHPSQRSTGLVISNNLIQTVSNWGLTGPNGFDSVTFSHNTHFQGGNIYTLQGLTVTGFIARDNITVRSPTGYGIKGDGTGEGTVALTTFAPGYVFTKNVVVGADANYYPAGNFYPASVATVQFVNYAGGNYALQVGSPYHNAATDGTDIGVNMPALLAAQSGAVPTPTPTPTSTPTPDPTPVPTPTPLPSNVCKPNQLISSGCTCLTRIVGPANKRRCK